ncbi:hypothetical protein L596_011465 [Steinernema carpocapsae]|uniref:Uncharacterized protein n=1 Tax=Steinernema carpocapsae TaxID=34508 RepID=A0A4U5NUE1_STECR|nr:hypothetical protein L596_011465 [Steinernema carpocapsae]
MTNSNKISRLIRTLASSYTRSAKGLSETRFVAGMEIVDESLDMEQPLEKDIFWEDRVPEPMYSAETANTPVNPQFGSAVNRYQPPDCVEMVARVDPCDKLNEEEQENEKIPVVVRRDSQFSEDGILTGVKRLIRNRRSTISSRSVPCIPPSSVIRRVDQV